MRRARTELGKSHSCGVGRIVALMSFKLFLCIGLLPLAPSATKRHRSLIFEPRAWTGNYGFGLLRCMVPLVNRWSVGAA